MIHQWLRRSTSRSKGSRSRSCRSHALRLWELEGLEGRALLSGNPTLYTVNSIGSVPMGSGNAGDLPYVIIVANTNANPAGSLIQFDPTVFARPQTILLSQTLVLSETNGPEMVNGPGASLLTISGNNVVEVFHITAGATAALSGLTISSGLALTNSGGGIGNQGSLTLTDSSVTGNSVSGVYSGGGLFSNGQLTITGSTITGNSVSGGTGGGISNFGSLMITGSTIAGNSVSGYAGGGGIANSGTLSMTDSTVAGNSVTVSGGKGGGISNYGTFNANGCTFTGNTFSGSGSGAGIYNQSNLTLFDSTIANNSGTYGGGIYNAGVVLVEVVNSTIAYNSANAGQGGGVFNAGGTLSVVNSTIAYNSGTFAGGVDNDGTLTVVNSTIADNTVGAPGSGGGLYAGAGTATLDNSIVALNTSGSGAGATPDDVDASGGGTVSPTSGYNLIGIGGSGGLANGAGGNQVGVAKPGLGALAKNGGPTDSIALFPGSPAIDAGSNFLAVDPSSGQPLTTDQRGPGYVRIYGGSVDIGAFEAQPTNPVPGLTSIYPNQIAAGYSSPITLTVNGSGFVSQSVVDWNATALATTYLSSTTLTATIPASDLSSQGNDSITVTSPAPGGGTSTGATFQVLPNPTNARADIVAVAVGWGQETAALQTAADGLRLLPAGRHTDLPWLNIGELQLTFNQPVMLTAAQVTISSARGIHYGPVTITGTGASDTIILARPIAKADRVTITIASATIATYTRRLDVLPGDSSDDGVVNSKDITIISNEWHRKKGATPTIFGDIVGNGTVNGTDYSAAKKDIGTKLPKLPKPSGKPPKAIEDRVLLASPTSYTVDLTSATGAGSGTAGDIAYVINQANANTNPAGSLIQFDPAVFNTPHTITLLHTLVLSERSGPEVIDGPGANLLTISGNNAVQVVHISVGPTAALSGLTISSGFSTTYDGGGIGNYGSLTLTDSNVTGNSARGFSGGGIFSNGPLTITGSTITGNSVSGDSFGRGGGIYNLGPLMITGSTIAGNSVSGYGGGGIANFGTLSMTHSTVAGNSVTLAGGKGGGIDNDGTLNANGCTFTGNTISGSGNGAGIYNQSNLMLFDSTIANNSGANGGGIFNTSMVPVEVVNSTIAYNSANGASGGEGGGVLNVFGTLSVVNSTIADNSGAFAGGVSNYGTLSVVNSTIADNTAGAPVSGGGLYVGAGTATLDNSIVALNTSGSGAGATPDDVDASGGGAVSPISGYNLIGTGGSAGLTDGANGNQVGVANPGLGSLANNGGPTETIALFPGSLAIDAGSNLLAVDPSSGQPLTTDQRGTGFVRVYNGAVDIGGFEAQPVNPVPGLTSIYPNQIAAGYSSPITLIVNGSGFVSQSVVDWNATALATTYLSSMTLTATIPASDLSSQGNDSITVTSPAPGGGTSTGATFQVLPNPTNVQADIVAIAVGWGQETAALQTAADGLRLLPAGRHTDLPWLNIGELQLTFNQPVTLTAAEVTISSALRINYGPVTITGTGTSDTIILARPIAKADRVTITIGGATIATYTRRLDVLPGDFNDNGVVQNNDVTAIRNEWQRKRGARPTIFGDVLGIGTVNGSDYNAARKRIGTKLPKVRSASLAQPGLRTEARTLNARTLPRPGGKTPGAAAAPALVPWPTHSRRPSFFEEYHRDSLMASSVENAVAVTSVRIALAALLPALGARGT